MKRLYFRILIEKIRDDNYRLKDKILGEEIKHFRVSKMYKKGEEKRRREFNSGKNLWRMKEVMREIVSNKVIQVGDAELVYSFSLLCFDVWFLLFFSDVCVYDDAGVTLILRYYVPLLSNGTWVWWVLFEPCWGATTKCFPFVV